VTAYTLKRSKRKTLAIYIKPDGAVEVRAPLRPSKADIDRFVESKAQWIANKQTLIKTRSTDGSESNTRPQSLYAPGEFENTIQNLMDKSQTRLGVSCSFVGVRKMTSRWGSCTAKTRRIRINAALEYCPRECLEYVVVHELAHLRECNHSPRFWAIVASALPDYKARQTLTKSMQWVLNIKQEEK